MAIPYCAPWEMSKRRASFVLGTVYAPKLIRVGGLLGQDNNRAVGLVTQSYTGKLVPSAGLFGSQTEGSMKSKIHFLKQVSLFSSLEDKDFKEISTVTQKKSFAEHEIIFTQGDPGDALFVLTSGAVKVSLIGMDGKETTLKILYENDFFGEMSLLDGCHRSATVTTLEPVEALVIFRDDFIHLIKKNFAIILGITTSLCRRLRKTSEHVARLTFFDAFGKVAHVLLELANNEGKRKHGAITFDMRFTRQELANLTALSRETLTRVLYDFQARKYLRLEGKKITILNESLLKEEIIQQM